MVGPGHCLWPITDQGSGPILLVVKKSHFNKKIFIIQRVYELHKTESTCRKSIHVLHSHLKKETRNCVYETLCPQPSACPPSCSPGNLFIILLQLTKSEAPSFNSFQDIFIGSF